jgi:hypothetical protein
MGNPFPQGFAGSNPARSTTNQHFREILIEPKTCKIRAQVTWLAKTVFTDEDKRNLKVITEELLEIRKLIEELTEELVNLSDKQLMKSFNTNPKHLKESQVDSYKEMLERKLDIAKKEIGS